METVGSSTSIRGKGSGFSLSEMVSPIVMPSNPAMAIMSPASNFSTWIFLSPLNVYKAENLWWCVIPFSPQSAYEEFISSVPLFKRPIAICPT